MKRCTGKIRNDFDITTAEFLNSSVVEPNLKPLTAAALPIQGELGEIKTRAKGPVRRGCRISITESLRLPIEPTFERVVSSDNVRPDSPQASKPDLRTTQESGYIQTGQKRGRKKPLSGLYKQAGVHSHYSEPSRGEPVVSDTCRLQAAPVDHLPLFQRDMKSTTSLCHDKLSALPQWNTTSRSEGGQNRNRLLTHNITESERDLRLALELSKESMTRSQRELQWALEESGREETERSLRNCNEELSQIALALRRSDLNVM